MKITNTKVEYRINPMGIDVEKPTFGWNIETEKNGWIQKAYQILVSDNKEDLAADKGTVWDSGMVLDKTMVNIAYQGKALESDTYYYWKVRVWEGEQVSNYSEPAQFHTGLLSQDLWQGSWIGEVDATEHHMYRKAFSVKKDVAQATLFISGLGHYEVFVNGEKPDDRVLDPGWTTYEKSCLYATYDLTNLLVEGNNAIGVLLGDGMYHVPGKSGRYAYFPRSYGYSKVLAQFQITYTDGTTDMVVTDESWTMAPSPVTYSCIYGGEEYDARLEQKGFATGAFIEDDTWQPVNVVEAPKGKLVSQKTEPLRVMQTYKPTVKLTKPDTYLYDFGKNFSGWVRLTIKMNGNPAGTVIKTKTAELLKPDGISLDQKVTGRNYGWLYTANGDEIQVYAPHFTYTGFRWMQLEGAIPCEFADENTTKPIIIEAVGEFIYPDMEITGDFWCSNELFNGIHQIITQAMLSNIKSIFTDCPHREKLGWLEETHLIGPAMMFNYDLHNLYEKVEQDMTEAQHEDGLVADICPEYVTGFGKYHMGFIDSPEWGSACVINPWYMYQKYGDSSIFERYYDTMKKYTDYLTSKTHHCVLHHGLGDWLDIGPNVPHSQNTPVPVIATTVYYYDLSIMHKVAGMLGKSEDEAYYKKLMEETKKEFNLQFYDDQTYRYATGSQAAQAMSLLVGLVEEDNVQGVLSYLERDIVKREYATTAGDVGHPFVTAALTTFGKSHVMNEMMNITHKPGYGYQVVCGATTLTEEWDGPDLNRPHGSLNHLMLGSGEEWFYAGLSGIQGMRQGYAFDELLIKPHFAKGVDHVKTWHKHPYGKIAVEWERQEEKVLVNVTLPAGTSGIFVDECSGEETVIESGTTVFECKMEA